MLSNVIDVQSYRMLAEKLLPLAVQYEKSGVAMLSVSLQLTCAKIFNFIGLKQHFCFTLADAWKSCQLLGFEDKSIAFNLVLKAISQGKLPRKWVFYRTLMSSVLKNANQTESAMEALSELLKFLVDSNDGWSSIRRTIMREQLRLAENSSDRNLYYIQAWKYLASEASSIDSDDQIRIIDSLRKRATIESINPPAQTLSPIFVGLQMIPLKSGLLINNATNGTASEVTSPFGPFIYAPNQDVTRKLSPCTNLIMNEPVEFTLILKNPFVAPLELEDIRLLFDNPEVCSCSASSVIVPALSTSFPVNISILPRNCGNACVTGVAVKFLKIPLELKLEKPLEYTVAPMQPLLQWSGTETEATLVFYEGELLSLDLPLKNYSEMNIKSLSVSFITNETLTPLEDRINLLLFERPLSETVMASSELESFDSDSITIPTAVYGHYQLCGFIANILYSGCSKFWRQLSIPYSCKVVPMLSVKDCEFVLQDEEACRMKMVLQNESGKQLSLRINDDLLTIGPNDSKQVNVAFPRLKLDAVDLGARLALNE